MSQFVSAASRTGSYMVDGVERGVSSSSSASPLRGDAWPLVVASWVESVHYGHTRRANVSLMYSLERYGCLDRFPFLAIMHLFLTPSLSGFSHEFALAMKWGERHLPPAIRMDLLRLFIAE